MGDRMLMLTLLVTLGVTSLILNVIFIFALLLKCEFGSVHKHFLCNLVCCNILISISCLNWDILSYLPFPNNGNITNITINTTIVITTSPNNNTNERDNGSSSHNNDYSSIQGIIPLWVCAYSFIVTAFGYYSSIGTVIAMGIERCIAVRNAHQYKNICTVRNARIAIGIIHALAVTLSLIPIEDFLANISPSASTCHVTDVYPRRYGTLLIGTFFLIYLVAQIVTLSVLVASLVQFTNHSHGASEEVRQNRESLARAARATRMIICNLILYIMTLFPATIVGFWISYTHLDTADMLEHELLSFAFSVGLMFTYIDPIIYMMSSVKSPCARRVHPMAPNLALPRHPIAR